MASGGMDWAYRVLAQHKLDALGAAVVLHLGWRDAPSMRSDKGIARALGQHRTSIARATAKLAAMGIIQRDPKRMMWLASETVAIVRGDASAPQPDRESRDRGTPHASPGGRLTRHKGDASRVPKRKENKENRRAGVSGARLAPSRSPHGCGAAAPFDLSDLTAFQLSQIAAGSSVTVAGTLIAKGSSEAEALLLAARRRKDAEKAIASV